MPSSASSRRQKGDASRQASSDVRTGASIAAVFVSIIAGALELGERSEYEREFYLKAILKMAVRADTP
ncbi:hypothetical protein [Haladaptatus sp. DFWS20]|uniref:hypothetical protein n=1 Tax=Haladaptatus sp. DFWS20 TaxID=3403467 RepID=UPI003EB6F1BE